MTNRAIKIVRPWPAEQPRPPQIRRTGCVDTAAPEPANGPRPERAKSAAA